jgi:HlyD family secretion protein
MKIITSKIFWILLILCFGTFGYYYFRSPKVNQPSYLTQTVKLGEIKKIVTASGTINPVNVVKVGTQVSGTIEKIYVDFNSEVEKGELLAQLDTSVLQANKDSAAAEVKKAKANKELAELTAQRNRELFKKDYIAKSELDNAEAGLKSSIADYDSALANLKKAERNLSYAFITSPVSGIVIKREVDAGQTVAASLSTPDLFEIAQDLTKMQIEASISEADVGAIKKGQDVIFTVDAFDNEEFAGKINQIRLSPTTENNVVTYTVIVDIDNEDMRLLPGMTAFLNIIIENQTDILKVSGSALNPKLNINTEIKLKNSKESMVYRLNGENIEPLKVEKGISNDEEVQIISEEIKAGDVLIEDILNNNIKGENKKSNGRSR